METALGRLGPSKAFRLVGPRPLALALRLGAGADVGTGAVLGPRASVDPDPGVGGFVILVLRILENT